MISPAGLAISFAEGLALILSPCILPVLPLMLGASIDGSKARPLGITLGFAFAFTIFAVISREAAIASGLDAELIRNISLYLLMGFGIVMLFPALSDRWSASFQKLGNAGDGLIARIRTTGFWGGLAIGALIGVVWTPCAGPILAAAIVQIIQAQSDAQAYATIAAFSLGAGIPMFLIALFGRYLMGHMGFLKRNSARIRRVIGVVMIAAALTILTGFDLKLVAWQAQNRDAKQNPPTAVKMLEQPYAAPELAGITQWLNSDPLTLQQLRGKVVLIDFWTYSCINCIRTMPYVTGWYDKYKDDGLVVIGVHAPEFAFEKKIENVREAVAEYGIKYPVALDNDFATWRAYSNKYWPAHYLIDREGRVVYTHYGEGLYEQTENNIRAVLGLKGAASVDPVAIRTMDQTPETYLGSERRNNFVSVSDSLAKDQWTLTGSWTTEKQRIISTGDDARLRINFKAGKVFLVMGSSDGKPVDVTLTLNGKALKTVTVTSEKLYTLYESGLLGRTDGMLELAANRAGLQAYAFTFGK